MYNKKIGDRVKSTRINETPVATIEGTIIEIEYNGIGEAVHALVDQDDGETEWWSL